MHFSLLYYHALPLRLKCSPQNSVLQRHNLCSFRWIRQIVSEHNNYQTQIFYVLLTVHLSIFILVISQLDAQIFLFYNKFISCLYMFRAHVLIIRSLWYHHTYRYDDTRGCVMQF